jgi:TonB family protein
MRELVGVLILLVVSVGFSTADDQAQQPSTTSHEGYTDCSLGTNHELIPVYLEPCQQPVGNLACGQKVLVLERYSPSWLKIQTPDGITRYIRSLSVSQAPDKFVAFDERSDIPKGDAADCSSPVYRVGAGVSAPHPVSTPNPEYTDEARKAGYEGSCQLQMIVGTDGKTHDIKVVRSVGHGLDEKAIEAVKQWKFTPAMKSGKPVAVQINVTVSFRLYGQPNSRKSSH